MHVCEIEFLLTLILQYLLILAPVIISKTFLFTPCPILFRSHHYRSVYICPAYLVTYYISVECIVIFYHLLEVVRSLQIIRALIKVFKSRRVCWLYLPSWVEQRIRYLLLVYLYIGNIHSLFRLNSIWW